MQAAKIFLLLPKYLAAEAGFTGAEEVAALLKHRKGISLWLCVKEMKWSAGKW